MEEQQETTTETASEEIVESTESTEQQDASSSSSSEENVSHEIIEGEEGQENVAGEDPGDAQKYTPNLKYKFMGEERELPELFRSLLTSEDSEKQVRDYIERAEALPLYKERYAELQKQYEETAPIVERFQELAQLREKDLEGFLSAAKIDDQALFKLVADKLKFMELPKEQQEIYNRDRENRLRLSQVEKENQHFQQRIFQEEVQARTFQLDTELGKADVKQVADKYDSLYGAGAFRDEVVKMGKYEWAVNKRDIPVAEAIKSVLGRAKPIYETAKSVGTQQVAKPPVIPNVRSGGSAPVKKQINSIAELKKMAQERRA